MAAAGAVLACASAAGADEAPILSRITLEAPVYTHHFPQNALFNNQNWGLFVDVALSKHWALVGGAFRNSYDRNTAVLGVEWDPLQFPVSKLDVRAGVLGGFDLNGGYKGFNTYEPLVGALSVRFNGARFGPSLRLLNRTGLAFKVIPAGRGGSTALNVALTYRLAD